MQFRLSLRGHYPFKKACIYLPRENSGRSLVSEVLMRYVVLIDVNVPFQRSSHLEASEVLYKFP